MNETPFDREQPPEEADRLLDLYLASLPRFDPNPAFADQVMARVVIRRPAVRLVPWLPRELSLGPRGRRVLTALSGSAAVTSTALTAWVAANFEALTVSATSLVAAWGLTAWEAVRSWVPGATAGLRSQLGLLAATWAPEQLAAAIGLMLLSVPIGMFGLYLAARPPLRTRMVSHAAP